MANVLTNLFNVATGSGAHEAAMREYINPFKGGQSYNIAQGPVADYMSGYLKDYVDPANQAGGTWKDGIMSVTGLGQSPNPFTKEGLAIAANLSSDPSFQAENLFGEGTLKQTPSGYEYTGGKFDFNFDPNSFLGKVEKNIFQPSEYTMSFDKDFNPITKDPTINKNLFTQYHEDDPYAGIQGQTAGLNIPLMVKSYLKNRMKYGAATTAANLALEAKAKAEAKKKADVAEEARRQQQLGAARSAADRKNIQQIQKYTGRSLSDYRMSRPSSERGFTGHGKSGMGRDPSDRMADGGLINFYRYGGFSG